MLTFRQELAQNGPVPSSQQAKHPSTLQSVPPVGSEEVLAWRRDGVQHRVLRRLRKGGYPISGKLDLHGRTLAQAQADLWRFLNGAHDQGAQEDNPHMMDATASNQRCLLIVHGKSASSAAPARLKNCVYAWLRRHPNVNALHSARPKDGGAGAVYVLLSGYAPA